MIINNLNILLADDDTDDCIFFKEALEGFSMETHLISVNDGERLMQYLNDQNSKLPDVLFLDLNMLRKNGFECLLEIKSSKVLKHFPVIVYSTSLEQESVDRLYKIGAHFFIRKPAEFPLFKKIIQKALLLISKENILQPIKENFVLTVSKD
jgi:CheY-like chemotaxis protein